MSKISDRDKKVWEKLNNMSIHLYGDFHDFVPKWLHEHFYMEKLNLNFTVENVTNKLYRPYSSGISAPGLNFIFSVNYDY